VATILQVFLGRTRYWLVPRDARLKLTGILGGSIAASATVGEMCVNDKLAALAAELQVIELWDRTGERADPPDELDRAGLKARRLRRLEIIREIEALTGKSKCLHPRSGLTEA
jgi:hypothetical protein